MCSRYSLTSPAEAVRATFGLAAIDDFPPRYNIAPSQPVAIIRTGTNGAREFALVRWGLIPSWVKDPRTFTMIINARAESALEKPSFRNAMKYRRCLVPADGFYEWTGPVGNKQPHLIRPKSNAPIAFAGLWEHWMGADGSEMESMSIVTTEPNATVATIHDRMPVILAASDYDAWLDARGVTAQEAHALLKPAPDDLLVTYPVNRAVSNSRNEGAHLQNPA